MLVLLTGYMGCGKTAIGYHLANAMGLPFLDMDSLLEVRLGMPLHHFFEKVSEAAFRTAEKDLLRKLCAFSQGVVATGGGTLVDAENMQLALRSGFVVFIDTDPFLLHSRLREEKELRPLINKVEDANLLQFIQQHRFERLEAYQQAHLIFRPFTSSASTEAARLRKLLPSKNEPGKIRG